MKFNVLFILLIAILGNQTCQAYLYRFHNTSKQLVEVTVTDPATHKTHNFKIGSNKIHDLDLPSEREQYGHPEIKINGQFVEHIMDIEIICHPPIIGETLEIKKSPFAPSDWWIDSVCISE